VHAEDTLTIAQQVRAALADGSALTVAEIFDRCDIESTTAIASTCWSETAAKRLTRTGERGNYTYKLTPTGQAAAENPRFLRSRSNRARPDRTRAPLPPSRATRTTDPAPSAKAPQPRRSAGGGDGLTDAAVERVSALVLQATGHGEEQVASASPTDAAHENLPTLDDVDLDLVHPSRRLAAAVLLYWPAAENIPRQLQRILLESAESALPR
jgi:hypothetical protein